MIIFPLSGACVFERVTLGYVITTLTQTHSEVNMDHNMWIDSHSPGVESALNTMSDTKWVFDDRCIKIMHMYMS